MDITCQQILEDLCCLNQDYDLLIAQNGCEPATAAAGHGNSQRECRGQRSPAGMAERHSSSKESRPERGMAAAGEGQGDPPHREEGTQRTAYGHRCAHSPASSQLPSVSRKTHGMSRTTRTHFCLLPFVGSGVQPVNSGPQPALAVTLSLLQIVSLEVPSCWQLQMNFWRRLSYERPTTGRVLGVSCLVGCVILRSVDFRLESSIHWKKECQVMVRAARVLLLFGWICMAATL